MVGIPPVLTLDNIDLSGIDLPLVGLKVNKTKEKQMTSNKELNKYIEEGIKALIEIQGSKELLSSVVESICEKFEYEKAEANQIISKAYQKKYEEEKYTKTKERTEKVYEVVEGV